MRILLQMRLNKKKNRKYFAFLPMILRFGNTVRHILFTRGNFKGLAHFVSYPLFIDTSIIEKWFQLKHRALS